MSIQNPVQNQDVLDLISAVQESNRQFSVIAWLPGWQPRCQIFVFGPLGATVSGFKYPVYGDGRPIKVFGPIKLENYRDTFDIIKNLCNVVSKYLNGEFHPINSGRLPRDIALARKQGRKYEIPMFFQIVERTWEVVPIL